ncbi:VPA1262 family protein [Sphingobacterium faecium]|uniref:VPA1262 family protein n=1 Tax=Sphingobacterium faecium TaxID=34087 RepID=UPI003207C7DA
MIKKNRKKDATSAVYPSLKVILDEIYCWQIWILKISSNRKATALRLLYSWITHTNSTKNGWQPESVIYSRNFEIERGQSVKMELLQCECIASGVIIQQYINGLLEGKLISDIDIEVDGDISNSLLNFKLGADKPVIDRSYIVRPEVILPINHLLVPWMAKNLPSPTDYAVFVNQLFYIPKQDLLVFDGYQLKPDLIKSLIVDLTQMLEIMTGFDLSRESAPRIGNIEWFRLPVSDKNAKPLISYEVIKESEMLGKQVNVYLQALPSNEQKNVLVNCRIINGSEITLDEVRSITWTDKEECIEFHNSEPVSKIYVKVWEIAEGTEEYTIVFEKSSNCVRMIHSSMSMIGAKIDTGKINLLDKLMKSEEHRREELAKFDRSTHVSTSTIENYKNDPWVMASRSIVEFMKYTLPDKSKAEFFPNGWDEQKKESGQLSFVQWILKLISGQQKSTLLFIDPYFDKDGIEIFAHARTTNTKFHLLTCTQHREKENKSKYTCEAVIPEEKSSADSEENKDGLTDAARSIKDTCENYKRLLNGIDICIDDLVSKNGGRKPLFHDRYLIVFDENGNLHYGFHLSNSLQGATRKEPLLVTPIPMDLMIKVNDYLSELIAPEKVSVSKRATTVVNIFRLPEANILTTKGTNEAMGNVEISGKLGNIPNVKFLFSKLLNNPDLESISNDDFKNYLKNQNVFDVEDNSILMCNITPEQWIFFATYLASCSQEEFNLVVASLGKCFANSQNYRKMGFEFYSSTEELIHCIKDYPEIEDKLLIFIKTFNETKGLDRSDRLYQMFMKTTFEQISKGALLQIHYASGDFFSIGFPFYYAMKFYMGAFPLGAFSFWQELIQKARTGEWNEANPDLRLTMLLISACSHLALKPYGKDAIGRLKLLIVSSSMELRAAAAAALIMALKNEANPEFNYEEFKNIVFTSLNDPEYRIAMAMLIKEFMMCGNKDIVEPILRTTTSALSDNWSGDNELILRVINVLYGNIKFNNSNWINNHFFKPIQLTGIIDQLFCFEIWNSALLQKIAPKKNYKKSGSEDTEFYYSAISDDELTVAIADSFGELTAIQQKQILDDWFNTVAPLWKIIDRPFLKFSDYTLLSGASTQLYWLSLLLEYMILKDKFKEGINDKAREFLNTNSVQFKAVSDFIENRGYSQFIDLKKYLN